MILMHSECLVCVETNGVRVNTASVDEDRKLGLI